MNFSNYKMLCEAMGAAKKAGMDNDEDFEQLEVAVEKLIGSFKDDANAKLSAVIRGKIPMIESRDAARDAVNGLCEKYSVPLVCDPAETVRQTASDLAAEAARLLCRDDAGIAKRMESEAQSDEETAVGTSAIRLMKTDDSCTG